VQSAVRCIAPAIAEIQGEFAEPHVVDADDNVASDGETDVFVANEPANGSGDHGRSAVTRNAAASGGTIWSVLFERRQIWQRPRSAVIGYHANL